MTLVRDVIPADAVLEVLHFEPGDLVLVCLAHEPDPADVRQLMDSLGAVLPDGVHGAVLPADVSLEELDVAELEMLLAARKAGLAARKAGR